MHDQYLFGLMLIYKQLSIIEITVLNTNANNTANAIPRQPSAFDATWCWCVCGVLDLIFWQVHIVDAKAVGESLWLSSTN